MITYKTGDIFLSNAQVITNPVNCVGVMGKGLALQFKKRFPEMFKDYKNRCERGEVVPGRPCLWENDDVQILNFPTKRHWKEVSQLSDIEEGFKYLSGNYAEMGVSTLALPPLGCGLGCLKWSEVKSLIEKYLEPLVDLEVFVFNAEEESESLLDDQHQSSRPSSSESGQVAVQQSLL